MNQQTTIALTFLPHIISAIGGVRYVQQILVICTHFAITHGFYAKSLKFLTLIIKAMMNNDKTNNILEKVFRSKFPIFDRSKSFARPLTICAKKVGITSKKFLLHTS